MFIILLIVILIVLYFVKNDYKDNFDKINNNSCKSNQSYNRVYPFDPIVPTPNSNYIEKTNKINCLNQYKKDLSVALAPTPTIHCPNLKDKEKCNKYGCNWYGTFCSSTYPTQY
jgi:hypothetical protein